MGLSAVQAHANAYLRKLKALDEALDEPEAECVVVKEKLVLPIPPVVVAQAHANAYLRNITVELENQHKKRAKLSSEGAHLLMVAEAVMNRMDTFAGRI